MLEKLVFLGTWPCAWLCAQDSSQVWPCARPCLDHEGTDNLAGMAMRSAGIFHKKKKKISILSFIAIGTLHNLSVGGEILIFNF